MKIGIYTDVHFCSSASLVRTRGLEYSTRLENCIQSVSWAENYFEYKECDEVVCLGDFFDKSSLGAEEITALNKIHFNSLPHRFLVGNHEMVKHDGSVSSVEIFRSKPNFHIYNKPTQVGNILFLPYVPETDKEELISYIDSPVDVIFSHNDIKGIRYGAIVNETGFSIDEIEANCKMFINGHLHNAQVLNNAETLINLGNLTGINFNEDATIYDHFACILDTDTMSVEFIINPYAFNFYKIEFDPNINYSFKSNAVITLRVRESDVDAAKTLLYNNNDIIITTRMIVLSDQNKVIEDVQFDTIDYLSAFKSFMLSKLEQTEVLNEELSKLLEVK